MKHLIQIPILKWLPNYTTTLFKGDFVAGITVGIMVIPQGMAYAMIAGLPPIYGLYTSMIPAILYAIFGTSRQLSVGPIAMVSLLVATGVGAMAAVGTEMYITLVLTLALMVGAIQFLLGIFRLGFLVNFLSNPVISGFTSGAALIIGFSQLKHLLGIDLPRSSFLHEIVWQTIQKATEIHALSAAIGLAGIVLILLTKRYIKKIPGPLVAVAFGIIINYVFDLTALGLKIIGDIPVGLPTFAIPSLEADQIQNLFPIALTIALVGFMQSIAIAKSIQTKHQYYKVIPNQELIALGIANMGGAFFQAYPAMGSFSQTAVNDETGGKTGITFIVSVAFLALTLLFLTPVFYYLPKAILASIIMVVVLNLFDWKEAVRLWNLNRTDFWVLMTTFLSTLIIGIEFGVLIGVCLSIALVIYQSTKPHLAVLGKIPNESLYKNLDRFKCLEDRSDILIIRFDAKLYFANITYFKDSIEALFAYKGKKLKLFILDADSINNIDSSGIQAIETIIQRCQKQNIEFYLVGVKGPVRDIFQKANLFDIIGKEHFFMRIQHAVDFFDKKNAQNLTDYTLQHNIE